MNITKHIPKGHLNRIKREELMKSTGLSDRKNRILIEKAIEQDHVPICSHSRKPGYYITDNPLDMIASALDNEAKAYALLKKAKTQRLIAAEMRVENGKQVNLIDFM